MEIESAIEMAERDKYRSGRWKDAIPEIQLESRDVHWAQMLRDEFLRPSTVKENGSSLKAKQNLKERKNLAMDFQHMLNEIEEHEFLLAEYGWGTKRSDAAQRLKVARVCGLSLPEEFDNKAVVDSPSTVDADQPAFRDTAEDRDLDPITSMAHSQYS